MNRTEIQTFLTNPQAWAPWGTEAETNLLAVLAPQQMKVIEVREIYQNLLKMRLQVMVEDYEETVEAQSLPWDQMIRKQLWNCTNAEIWLPCRDDIDILQTIVESPLLNMKIKALFPLPVETDPSKKAEVIEIIEHSMTLEAWLIRLTL